MPVFRIDRAPDWRVATCARLLLPRQRLVAFVDHAIRAAMETERADRGVRNVDYEGSTLRPYVFIPLRILDPGHDGAENLVEAPLFVFYPHLSFVCSDLECRLHEAGKRVIDGDEDSLDVKDLAWC